MNRPNTPPVTIINDNASLSTPERTGVIRTVNTPPRTPLTTALTPNTKSTPERTRIGHRRGRNYAPIHVGQFPNLPGLRTPRTPQGELIAYYASAFDYYYDSQNHLDGQQRAISAIDSFNRHFIEHLPNHVQLFPRAEDAIHFYNLIMSEVANNTFPYNNEPNIDLAMEAGIRLINRLYHPMPGSYIGGKRKRKSIKRKDKRKRKTIKSGTRGGGNYFSTPRPALPEVEMSSTTRNYNIDQLQVGRKYRFILDNGTRVYEGTVDNLYSHPFGTPTVVLRNVLRNGIPIAGRVSLYGQVIENISGQAYEFISIDGNEDIASKVNEFLGGRKTKRRKKRKSGKTIKNRRR
tara:strand:- start:3969 stop:5012 length:1044 start_codon:yes stop_codon:yes gene_type:complete